MRTIITFLVSSLLCFRAAAGTLSSYAATNTINNTDTVLVSSDVGGGNFATRKMTVSTLASKINTGNLPTSAGTGTGDYRFSNRLIVGPGNPYGGGTGTAYVFTTNNNEASMYVKEQNATHITAFCIQPPSAASPATGLTLGNAPAGSFWGHNYFIDPSDGDGNPVGSLVLVNEIAGGNARTWMTLGTTNTETKFYKPHAVSATSGADGAWQYPVALNINGTLGITELTTTTTNFQTGVGTVGVVNGVITFTGTTIDSSWFGASLQAGAGNLILGRVLTATTAQVFDDSNINIPTGTTVTAGTSYVYSKSAFHSMAINGDGSQQTAIRNNGAIMSLQSSTFSPVHMVVKPGGDAYSWDYNANPWITFHAWAGGRDMMLISTNSPAGAFYVEAAGIASDFGLQVAGSGVFGAHATPDASAILEARSTSKGFLLPRMTKAQRNAISSPVAGLAVYQTDNTPGLRVYNGTSWVRYTETTDP